MAGKKFYFLDIFVKKQNSYVDHKNTIYNFVWSKLHIGFFIKRKKNLIKSHLTANARVVTVGDMHRLMGNI